MLDKAFDHGAEERRIYEEWERAGCFAAGAGAREGAEPYSIVIPPPNVTGSLHMGHALNNTLQDVLIRWRRMAGDDVLWQPGCDHAGIATQMVVERQLMERQEPSRRTLGREAFVERVWAWKEESGGTITNQLKRLGASCDWTRERFTMDEGLSAAVLKVFVTLHRQGLVYKDRRLVNWDPKLLTAISDLEVEQVEVAGHLWHFKYPIEDAQGEFLTVATTRPETMLGDTGVAVHPNDARYAHLIGRHCVLPLVGRRIPIIADDYADPETGSGAVKMTPAHDFNDFEVGRRHDLEMINIFDEHAAINDNAPEAYRGLDRFEARKRVVADMEAAGLLAEIEDHRHQVPHGDRGGVPIEPWLTDQWYVDAAALAAGAIRTVERGDVSFTPKTWENTYFEWMRNIQPWCVSRQLWWGHRIPAWYGPDGAVFVAESEAEAAKAARAHYGEEVALTRDPDVLDTWFSSALWPFSTQGWPEETEALARYYPTSVLVTGFDIIFFWVARMMMAGLHFMGEKPFRDVYIHALVRDERGQKMSKSKGNVMDPLELIDEFGADALRFTLAAMAAQGRDIKLSKDRVAGYRNFATKLWNAARFCDMNECRPVAGFDPAALKAPLNRWIVGETARVAAVVDEGLRGYRFNEAAGAVYRHVWNVFCDWWVEAAKPALQGPDGPEKDEARAVGAWALGEACALLHPFMPFVTEALWSRFGRGERPLALSAWPSFDGGLADAEADAEIGWLIATVSEIRSTRSELNAPAGAKLPLTVAGANAETRARLATHGPLIERLARLSSLQLVETPPKGAVQIIVDEAVFALDLAGAVDLAAEAARLEKEIAKLAGDMKKLDAKLANEKFLANAPQAVVEETRERRADLAATQTRLTAALARLREAG